MHSDKQIKDIQEGVRLLKLKKKKPLAVIENSNDSNASCFKRSESLKKFHYSYNGNMRWSSVS
jgi:hypothetical protein